MNKKISVSIKDCEEIFCDWAIKKGDHDAALKIIKHISADKEITTAGFLVMVALKKIYNESNDKIFARLDEYYQEELIIQLAGLK